MNTLRRCAMRNAASFTLPVRTVAVPQYRRISTTSVCFRRLMPPVESSKPRVRTESSVSPSPPPQAESTHDEATRFHATPWHVVLATLTIFTGLHFLTTHLFVITSPYGVSMLPTLSITGEWVLILRTYAKGVGIHVGDVIAARHPVLLNERVVKRVLGMPGDLVCVGKWNWETGERRLEYVRVPVGHCWLEGDNVGLSRDSRLYGAVPLGLVMGKVTWRLLPWAKFGRMGNGLDEIGMEEVDIVT